MARRAKPRLYTIGYAELTPNDLVERLRKHHVAVLVDVRESARSRRRGFAKTALRTAVEAAGIDYQHRPELGVPKPERDAYHATGDFQLFAMAYRKRLATEPEAVRALVDVVTQQTTCLLCLEADAQQCHRSLLAAHIAEECGARVEHLS